MVDFDWEYLFEGKILSRGYNYYLMETISNFRKIDNTIVANVSGTSMYHVEITFDDGEISSMYCDCPYYDNCKHMVAVLEYLENDKPKILDYLLNYNSIELDEEEDVDIKDLVNSTDNEKLKEFVINELKNNYEMFVKFKTLFKKDFTDVDKNYYYNKLKNVFLEDNIKINFQDFINNDIQILLKRKEFDFVYDLTFLMFDFFSQLDECYYIDELMELAISILLNLYETDYKVKLFERLSNYFRKNFGTFKAYYIASNIFYNYEEKEFLEKKIELFDEIISENPHDLEFWVNFKTDMMIEIGKSKEECIDFRKKYSNLKGIIDYDIDEAIIEEKFDIAIELLENIKNEDFFDYFYMVKLSDLYKKVGNIVEYKKSLKELLFVAISIDYFDYYKKYKSLCSKEEWLLEREEIFTHFKDDDYSLKKFYNEEKLYDRLFELIKASNYIEDFNEYKDVLKKDYANELNIFYSNYIMNMATPTTNRKTYKEIVSLLENMMSIPGGDKLVKSMVKEFRNKYKNRKAMMEELNRVF